MSTNEPTMAEVSIHAATSRDFEILRTFNGYVSEANPLRVHRYGEGFVVSLGMFYGNDDKDKDDPSAKLSARGLSDRLIECFQQAVALNATYLDINADATMQVKSRPYLDVSTGHLTTRDVDLLTGISSGKVVDGVPAIILGHEHGFIVNVASVKTEEQLVKFGFSEDFARLIEHAKEKGASFVDLDADADYVPGLSIFDHETDRDITVEIEEEVQSSPKM
jgi:hypothetical protein